MFKYLLITAATAIVNLVLVSTYPVQIADAAIDSVQSISPIDRDKLITKEEKPIQLNTKQQSDVESIRKTLTEFYRGFNEYSVDRMERVVVPVAGKGKETLQKMFSQLKSSRVDMSIEVRGIELVSLSEHNALVRIEQSTKVSGRRGKAKMQHSVSIALVKNRGSWKISDSDMFIQAASLGH
jgi:ketosteroid isomerase-like protein